jgi:hypothetical protein
MHAAIRSERMIKNVATVKCAPRERHRIEQPVFLYLPQWVVAVKFRYRQSLAAPIV